MALKEAIKEQIFIQLIISDLEITRQLEAKILYIDSALAIQLANNPQFHHRTKHIDIQYHFVRQMVLEGTSRLIHIPTDQQLADGFTKPVSQPN